MRIKSLVTHKVHKVFNEPAFKAILEDHLIWLVVHEETQAYEVPEIEAHRYANNLNGFLTSISVPPHLHWLVMRMSDLTTPLQFGEGTEYLLIPSARIIDDLTVKYKLVK